MDVTESVNGLIGDDVSTEATTTTQSTLTDFQKLPPEMVTAVLERLQCFPNSLLNGRLVCRQFKALIDDILEKRQWSLWNWSRGHGEGKPFTSPGPLKRPQPTTRVFQDSGDIDRFLETMATHQALSLSPFPSGGIYIRRVRKNPCLPEAVGYFPGGMENQTLHQIRMRSHSFFEHQSDTQDTGGCGMISVDKILSLLEVFGEHLSSLILEGGMTADLDSVKELANILERSPNIQYLMLKGIRVKNSDDYDLPLLPHLKSLKIIYCSGVTRSLLNSYHGQLITLQLLSSRDYWLTHLERLQRDYHGNIFGRLKSLKIGEFENPSEFDYLTGFLRSQQESKKPLRLEQVAIHYSIPNDFTKPTQKLFQILECLPSVREFSVGKSAATSFQVDATEERSNFNIGANMSLVKIDLPLHFIRCMSIVRKIFRSMRSLNQIRFLDCNQLLWDIMDDRKVDQALGLLENMTLSQVLKELMDEEFSNVSKISVVTCFGGAERVVRSVSTDH